MMEKSLNTVTSLPLRVIYCIDRASAIRCLAKSQHAVPIQVLKEVEPKKVICQVDIQHVIQTVCRCSPELSCKSQGDFSVYFLDHTEPDELFVGLGYWSSLLLSPTLNAGTSNSDTVWVNGFIVEFGIQRSIEIKLRFQSLQNSFEVGTPETHTSSKFLSSTLPPSLIFDPSSSEKSDSISGSLFDTNYTCPVNINGLSKQKSVRELKSPSRPSALAETNVEELELDSLFHASNDISCSATSFSEPYILDHQAALDHPATDPVCSASSTTVNSAVSTKKRRRESSTISPESAYVAAQLQNPSEREQVHEFIKEQVRIARGRIEKKFTNVRGKNRIEEQLTLSLQEGKIPPYCQNCGTIKTANWRNATYMNITLMLCNACGIYWTSRRSMRPRNLWSTYKAFETEKPLENDAFAQLELAVYKLSQQRKLSISIFRELENAGRHSPLNRLTSLDSTHSAPDPNHISKPSVVNQQKSRGGPRTAKLKNDLRRIQSSPIVAPTPDTSFREPLSEIGSNDSWLVLPNSLSANIQNDVLRKTDFMCTDKENVAFPLKTTTKPMPKVNKEETEPTLPVCDSEKENDDLECYFRTPPKPTTLQKQQQSPSPWRSELFLSDPDQNVLTPRHKPKFDLSKALSSVAKSNNIENSPQLPERYDFSLELGLNSQLDNEERRDIPLMTDLVMPSSPPMVPADRHLSVENTC
ncbi:DNA-binding transcription factor for histones, zf-GATA-type Ams2 [Schizosaccharomyces pombe]|uniref:CENP-A multicopy suppressor protein 2 n=1 Tax=Schizosaccharomyces pombe (strain 972 / ATCC 24843) TaxID=284812 RepID=AMS2_SCHPO|nr:GATA-type transcription factor Ams2 [Schizosaccharomyces pombe]Q9URT4.2 RecName: Full=CENP-A multicopy suppressor protein 2 [Schizosaccharomyces pombe 972h-]CAB61504.2 cell cycle regulated GATA-type transcription factor Ams2 [Schizosaccharomyces pombe]|eukprot:NP_588400.2 GATA-type transcription factor Ams2 [Schizosaccharomyces pombe]